MVKINHINLTSSIKNVACILVPKFNYSSYYTFPVQNDVTKDLQIITIKIKIKDL